MNTQSIESFNIEYKKKYGFNAIAFSDLKPGDLVVHEQPFAFYILTEFQGQMCEVCFKYGIPLKRCVRCKQAHYCSKECQIKHWNMIHKLECKVFEKIDPYLLQQILRLTYRIYLRTMYMIQSEIEQKKDEDKQNEGYFKVSKDIHNRGKPNPSELQYMNSQPIPRTHVHTVNDILTLISHRDKINQQSEIQLHSVSSNLLEILGIDPNSPAKYYQNATAIDEAKEIDAKVVNNFELCQCGFTRENIAAIYPRLSLFNHSCRPNIKLSWNSDGSVFAIATRDIKKGETLYVSYVGQKFPFSIRQMKLIHWRINCDCPRCADNIEGQLILKDMEQEKKKGVTSSKYKDYKFSSDMYGEALVCNCGNPMFRVYENPHDVQKDGNEDMLCSPYYYLCTKCLVPQLTSPADRQYIDRQIAQIEGSFSAFSQFGGRFDYGKVGEKLPQFHPLSCVANMNLAQQFQETEDNLRCLPIGYQLIENFECSQEGQLNTQLSNYYVNVAIVEQNLNHLPQAYKLFVKGREILNILYSRTDNSRMLDMIETCNKQIQEIKKICKAKHISLN